MRDVGHGGRRLGLLITAQRQDTAWPVGPLQLVPVCWAICIFSIPLKHLCASYRVYPKLFTCLSKVCLNNLAPARRGSKPSADGVVQPGKCALVSCSSWSCAILKRSTGGAVSAARAAFPPCSHDRRSDAPGHR